MKFPKISAEVEKLFGKRKILVYDIETSPLKGWLWRPGREVNVSHNQLDKAYNEYSINTIAYKWLGENKVHCLSGDDKIEQFDKLARSADICIGKNSDNFDVKHINTQRLMQGLKAFPEWFSQCDDLEKQLRRFFIFPSMSLDYISGIFGLGGKVKMEMQDWIDIENGKQLKIIVSVVQSAFGIRGANLVAKLISPILYKDTADNIFKKFRIALTKMIFYNKKDVTDTETLLIKAAPHIKLRDNAATKGKTGCTRCGAKPGYLTPTKIITVGLTEYQQFHCTLCDQYAGRCTFHIDRHRHKKYGKMQSN